MDIKQEIINLWILTKAISKETGQEETVEGFLETLSSRKDLVKHFGGDVQAFRSFVKKVIEEFESQLLEEEK